MAYMLSRNQDLIDQIKQITIEIRDIKDRRKGNIEFKKTNSTFNVRNHRQSDPLQECHEEHDEDDVHYEDSNQTVHQSPDNKNTQTHCVPIQPLPAKGSISSHPPHPELHPSSPSNRNPSMLTSMTPPWKMMVKSSSTVFGDGPGADCKKEEEW